MAEIQDYPWSSSLYSENNAWYLNTNDYGNVNNNNRNNNYCVRAALIFRDMITLEDVYEAYLDCRKKKRSTREAIEFEINLEENLWQLYQDITDGSYYPSTSKCFVITKPKPREVFAANFRDRIIHHLIYNEINPCIDSRMKNNVFNCRKGKGVLCGVKTLRDELVKITRNFAVDKTIVKLDLKNFFPSIDLDILWTKLSKYLHTFYKGNSLDQILWLVKTVIYHRPQNDCIKMCDPHLWVLIPFEKSLFNSLGGLAIGNLTSQLFANFLLMGLDNLIHDYAELAGRYVDDFYMLGDKSIIYSIPKIQAYLQSLNICLHPNKKYIQPAKHGTSFLGHHISYHRTYCGNRTIYNALLQASKQQIELCSINSYLGYLRHHFAFKQTIRILKQIPKDNWVQYKIHLKPIYITYK